MLDVRVTASNMVGLASEEFRQLREERASAPDDGPNVAYDRQALALEMREARGASMRVSYQFRVNMAVISWGREAGAGSEEPRRAAQAPQPGRVGRQLVGGGVDHGLLGRQVRVQVPFDPPPELGEDPRGRVELGRGGRQEEPAPRHLPPRLAPVGAGPVPEDGIQFPPGQRRSGPWRAPLCPLVLHRQIRVGRQRARPFRLDLGPGGCPSPGSWRPRRSWFRPRSAPRGRSARRPWRPGRRGRAAARASADATAPAPSGAVVWRGSEDPRDLVAEISELPWRAWSRLG
jgi:hypothetical protein